MTPAFECKPELSLEARPLQPKERGSVCRERSISPDCPWEWTARRCSLDPAADLSAANETADGQVRAPTVRRLDLDCPTVGADVVDAKVDHIDRAGGERSETENRDCCAHKAVAIAIFMRASIRLRRVSWAFIKVVASAWPAVQGGGKKIGS